MILIKNSFKPSSAAAIIIQEIALHLTSAHSNG